MVALHSGDKSSKLCDSYAALSDSLSHASGTDASDSSPPVGGPPMVALHSGDKSSKLCDSIAALSDSLSQTSGTSGTDAGDGVWAEWDFRAAERLNAGYGGVSAHQESVLVAGVGVGECACVAACAGGMQSGLLLSA